MEIDNAKYSIIYTVDMREFFATKNKLQRGMDYLPIFFYLNFH